MEVAGLCLAVTQLFNTCLQGYRTLRTIRSFGRDAELLYCKLQTEEYRFNSITKDTGILEGKIELDAYVSIHNILYNISTLISDAEALRRKYSLPIHEALAPPSLLSQDGPPSLPGTRSPSPSPSDSAVDTSTLDALSQTSRSQKNLTTPKHPKLRRRHIVPWALFDKENFEQLIRDLRELNDSLFSHLKVAQQRDFRDRFNAFCIRTLDTNDISNLRIIADASGDHYLELSSPATQKAIRLEGEQAVEQDIPSWGPSKAADPILLLNDFAEAPNSTGQRCTVMHKESRRLVLLEWKAMTRDRTDVRWTRAMNRMATLANLLKASKDSSLKTLRCLGYVEDRTLGRVSLAFEYPPGSAREDPKTLFKYLKLNLLPSLDDRYILALKLAESVFRIHMSGWLHKAIRPQNILFFASDKGIGRSTPKCRILRSPYLCGFEFSREDVEDAVTETALSDASYDRYRHPNCQGFARDNYKKTFDIYSLGYVLLEIGCWQTFDEYPRYKSSISVAENRKRTIEYWLSGDLAYFMGERYEDVVRTCMTGDFGLDAKESQTLLLERFYDRVVKKLMACVNGCQS